MITLASLLCGFIFGMGLLISGMAQPTKVLAFLDIFGAWDPSLAVVMAAALAVTSAGFVLVRRYERPLLAPACLWPPRLGIDRPLVVGSVMFGLGWGLVGFCPGPALVNLATLSSKVIAFCVAMMIGMVLHAIWQGGRSAKTHDEV